MTNDELDQARAEEAFEQSKAGDLFTDIAAYAARLAREGWMPEPVDPDLAEAEKIRENSQYMFGSEGHIAAFLQAIKRGRELERVALQPKEGDH